MGVKVRLKDGSWYVFINHHGKRKAKRIGSDKKTAQQVARKIEAKLALGEFALLDDTPQQMTFADYAQDWLDQYVMVACKPSSARVLSGIVRNHLIPYFGSSDPRRITRTQVKVFITQKHRRYSRRYVRDLVQTLHTMLDHAVEEEILDRNPAAKMGRYLPEQNTTLGQEINPFTSQELTQYLSVVREHDPDHYPHFLCLARTGMREGEALGLFWDDIQFGQGPTDPHRFIHIQRTYDAAHQTFNTPKNGRNRRVDMSQEVRAELAELHGRRLDAALLRGTTTIPQVVFCGREGNPLSPSGLYRMHKRICEHAGLRANRVHDLRHSYAAIQLYEHHAPIQIGIGAARALQHQHNCEYIRAPATGDQHCAGRSS